MAEEIKAWKCSICGLEYFEYELAIECEGRGQPEERVKPGDRIEYGLTRRYMLAETSTRSDGVVIGSRIKALDIKGERKHVRVYTAKPDEPTEVWRGLREETHEVMWMEEGWDDFPIEGWHSPVVLQGELTF